ncbi:hypothetical protein E2986_12348 [Frieseomelitta varia]|uniref:Ion transport domain-containing protein n=1 Tax=Frieseomelitta varia TaxID=561572 RepID=A0A833RBD6_9HYME|nr:hypothetical protein E2986_12348 [Frieseomelitta varia]
MRFAGIMVDKIFRASTGAYNIIRAIFLTSCVINGTKSAHKQITAGVPLRFAGIMVDKIFRASTGAYNIIRAIFLTSCVTHHDNNDYNDDIISTSSERKRRIILYGLVTRYGPQSVLFPVFLCLIVGFALSFAVLFHGNDQFSNFWNSVVKTVVMMMGEYDYGDLFSENNGSSFLPVTSRIVFLIFVLASMVLVNLMIGIAVNDIQSLKKKSNFTACVCTYICWDDWLNSGTHPPIGKAGRVRESFRKAGIIPNL